MRYDFRKVQEAIDARGMTLQELSAKSGIHYSSILRSLQRGSARQSTAKALVRALKLEMKDILIQRESAA